MPSISKKALLSLAVIFGVMFLLNTLMPLHRDDYDYSLIWMTQQHITNLSDAVASFQRHYFLHGGRIMLGIQGFFMTLDKSIFNVLNALFFTLLILVIFFHGRREVSLKKEAGLLAATGLLGWLSFPHFGEVAVWMCGSFVYLWSGLIALTFLLVYNLHMAGTLHLSSNLLLLPMFFLGLFAGWSVENLAVTTVLASCGLTLYCRRQNNMPLWMPVGSFASLIGLALLVGAPGNFVRYDEQGKGFLRHIGNQFAGNGEMLLYLLPAILLLLCAWRVLKLTLAKERGIAVPQEEIKTTWKRFLLPSAILLLVISYFSNSFVAAGIRDFLIAAVMEPLNIANAKNVERFSHVMDGFEEMAIYWMIVFLIYGRLKKALGQTKGVIAALKGVPALDVLHAYPALRYSLLLFVMAFCTNFVMIGAPTFPARATFSSVAMILAGTIAILRLPPIRDAFQAAQPRRILLMGGAAIGAFTILSASLITYTLRQENDRRIAVVAAAAGNPEAVVTLPPIELKNRALRHVFFADFDNSVTKGGLCNFYGIKDIEVKEGASLEK